MINNLIHIIFIYYRFYAIMIPIFLIGLLIFRWFQNKYRTHFGTKKTLIILLSLFLLCGFTSHFFTRVVFQEDTVKIDLSESNYPDEVISLIKVSGNGYKASALLNTELTKKGASVLYFRLPIGIQRSIHLYTGDSDAPINMEYISDGIAYHESIDPSIREYGSDGVRIADSAINRVLIDFIQRCMITFMLVVSIFLLSLYAIKNMILSDKLKQQITQNRYGIFCLLFLLFQLYGTKASKIVPWAASSYVLNYSQGFGSRFMIGSLLRLFTGEYVSVAKAELFVLLHLVLLCIVVAYLINFLIIKSNYQKTVVFLCLLYLVSPGGLASYWNDVNLGRLEMYNFVYTLIAIIVFQRIRNTPIKYIFLVLFSLFNLAIYQGYIFLHYALIALIMYIDYHEHKDYKFYFVYPLLQFIITCIGFLIFQFFTNTNFADFTEMVAYIRQNSHLEINPLPLRFEYFSEFSESYRLVEEHISGINQPRLTVLMNLVILSPMILILASIWYDSMKEFKKKNLLCSPYLLPLLFVLNTLPQFLLNVDWGRWFSVVFLYLFFATLYMHYKAYPEMLSVFKKADSYFAKHPMMVALILLFIAALSKFQEIGMLKEAQNILSTIGLF